MTSRDFAYWLQGFFELSKAESLTAEQTGLVKKHLALVFYHEIDPSFSPDPVVQQEMQAIHRGNNTPESLENIPLRPPVPPPLC
jgi:hypothetical protein